jgi:putative ABC transport system permease protein
MISVVRRVGALVAMNFKLCLIETSSNKTRSFLSSFGIFLGVASLLILLSFVRAMNKGVEQSILRMGGIENITIRQIEPQNKLEALEFRRSPGLLLNQAEALQQALPDIERLLPQISSGHAEVQGSGKSAHGQGRAVTFPFFETYDYQFDKGRKFTPEETENGENVCVIGGEVSRRLFGPGADPVGKTLMLRQFPFRIVGVVHTEERWDRRAREVLYPLAFHLKYFSSPNPKFSEIILKARSTDVLEGLKLEITSRLTSLHRGVQDFEVVLNEDKIAEMKRTSRALDILLFILAALSLFIGGISITNIMFATIGDRIREIGLRKALGAKKSDLFVQFLIEAVLLCFVGGLPGMFFGSIPVLLPEGLLPMDPSLRPGDYVLGMGFTLFIGFAAGVFPALKAANMRPVEALQYA